MIQRRGLLLGILAAGYAPAAIGSGVLMPVRRIARSNPLLPWQQTIDEALALWELVYARKVARRIYQIAPRYYECLAQSPAIARVWPEFRRAWHPSRLPVVSEH